MGEITKIQWCDHTLNIVRGCAKVRIPLIALQPDAGYAPSGCDECYADAMSKRNPRALGVWGEEGTRVLASLAMQREPLRWNEDAKRAGKRAKVFAYSLGDVFEHPEKPENAAVCAEGRRILFDLVERTEWLDWLLLTKRPEHILSDVPASWLKSPPPNWWQGTSISVQQDADERIPHLLRVPSRVRFLSAEPLLGPVDLDAYLTTIGNKQDALEPEHAISWVIVGGESGSRARQCDVDWMADLIEQAKTAGVPAFFKQAGAKPYSSSGLAPEGRGHVDAETGLWRLEHAKGGDIEEMPCVLRVREFPRAA